MSRWHRVGCATLAAVLCAVAISPRAEGPERAEGTTHATEVFTFPDERGRTLLEAIAGARQSVDISIYSIGDERILDALKEAKAHGASIRLMVNGQNWIEPANYPGHEKYDAVYALMCGYSGLPTGRRGEGGPYAEICPASSPQVQGLLQASGTGRVMLHASCNNVALTHQKTVLIDAAHRNGRPLGAHEMGATSRALILTGNLSGWPWPNCASGGAWDPASCPFYSARDFGLSIADGEVIAEVERVFSADWHCHSPCETAGLLNEPRLGSSRIQLVWSNGITGILGTYPEGENGWCPPQALYPSAQGPGEGCAPYATGTYPFPLTGADGSSGGTIQGNARREILALIRKARKTLDIYNEEMADEQIVTALAERAAEGLRVRVVMTEGNPHTYWSESLQREVDGFDQLARASAQIRLFPNDPSALYIHAKMVLADVRLRSDRPVPDHAAAYLGSENISTASLNQNRELGVILGAGRHRPILKTLAETFERDLAQAPLAWAPGHAERGRADRARNPGHESRRAAPESHLPLVCGPGGFPFPRPSQKGPGPWNPGYTP